MSKEIAKECQVCEYKSICYTWLEFAGMITTDGGKVMPHMCDEIKEDPEKAKMRLNVKIDLYRSMMKSARNLHEAYNEPVEMSMASNSEGYGQVIAESKIMEYGSKNANNTSYSFPPMHIVGKSKIINGSRFIIGGKLARTELRADQHFNWFQKLMWKLCFGVKVEDFNEE